ncbi:hypothetical protein B0H17DRAFT_847069, partial [Mycena rosella]
MLKCAKKYGVEFDTCNPSREILGQIPIWHHFGADPDKKQYNNTKACKCLRDNHGVHTTGEGMAILERLSDPAHKRSPVCRCLACDEDRRVRSCNNPIACIQALERRLADLLPKWNPRRPQKDD